MVERVARGRIMVPAAAALTVMAAGTLQSELAHAAGRQATLEIRVQVVEPCRIRIAPSGALEQNCGGANSVSEPTTVELGNLFERSSLRLSEHPARLVPPTLSADQQPGTASPGFTLPTVVGPTVTRPSSASARFAGANQRARETAERISQRVRFITIAY